MSVKSISTLLTSSTHWTANEKMEEAENEYNTKSLYLAKCAHELKNVFLAVSGFLESNMKLKGDKADFITALCNFGLNIVSEMNSLCIKDIKPSTPINLVNDNFAIIPSIDFCVNIFQTKQKFEKELGDRVMIKKNMLVNQNQLVTSIQENHLKQIMINLLSNAYKFTLKGEISISCDYIEEHSKIRITVKDTGIGMSDLDMKYLFHPFEKRCQSNEMNSTGSGLGLCIIQDILAKYNSLLRVCSVKGKGTSFWFDLAIKKYPIAFGDQSDSESNSNSSSSSSGNSFNDILNMSNGMSINNDNNITLVNETNEMPTIENINMCLMKDWALEYKEKQGIIEQYLKKDNNEKGKVRKLKAATKGSLINKILLQSSLPIAISIPIPISVPIPATNLKINISKAKKANANPINNRKKKALRIMICDDESIIANSMKKLIKSACKEANLDSPGVILTKNGIECLYELYTQTISSNPIDLLILDENMPFINGSKLSQIIKSIPMFDTFPIYLVSSSSIVIANNSVDGFFEKPLSKCIFLNMIKNIKSYK